MPEDKARQIITRLVADLQWIYAINCGGAKNIGDAEKLRFEVEPAVTEAITYLYPDGIPQDEYRFQP